MTTSGSRLQVMELAGDSYYHLHLEIESRDYPLLCSGLQASRAKTRFATWPRRGWGLILMAYEPVEREDVSLTAVRELRLL
jgi:hypothetical protein